MISYLKFVYPGVLQNIRIAWLPANATSLHQPLDQGIIQNWKVYVRKQLVKFMVNSFDAGKDPTASINVLRVIRWGISAWENDVKPSTIQNCWGRSRVIDWGSAPFNQPRTSRWVESETVLQEITQDIRQMQVMGRIEEAMNIHQFINPPEEAIGDINEDIMNDFVSRYAEQERLAETDEEVEVTPVITVCQAQEACRILRLHEEQQLKGDMGMLRQLRRHERGLFERRQNSQKQSTLSTWVVAGTRGELGVYRGAK